MLRGAGARAGAGMTNFSKSPDAGQGRAGMTNTILLDSRYVPASMTTSPTNPVFISPWMWFNPRILHMRDLQTD
jgi:hypothetical protein